MQERHLRRNGTGTSRKGYLGQAVKLLKKKIVTERDIGPDKNNSQDLPIVWCLQTRNRTRKIAVIGDNRRDGESE